MQGVMKDDVSKETEAEQTSNVQRPTSNIEGNADQSRTRHHGNVSARQARTFEEPSEGSKIEDRRSQVDKHDARRRQLDAGERKFLEALIRFTRGAKRSRVPEVAVAARRWEGKIHFHVRVTLSRRSASQLQPRRRER
jgi:hypothetical protein